MRRNREKRISDRDANNLLILAVIIIMLFSSYMFYTGSRLLPLKWVFISALVLEVCVSMPLVCKAYYKVKTGHIPFYSYIPGINILQLSLNRALAVVFIISSLLTIGVGVFLFSSYDFRADIFGDSLAHTLLYSGIGYLIVCVVVLSFAIGAIYTSIQMDVLSMVCDLFHTNIPTAEYLFTCLLFIPVIRTCSILHIYMHLATLQRNRYCDYVDTKSKELYEEEIASGREY